MDESCKNGIFLRDLLKTEEDELLNSNFWPLGHLLFPRPGKRKGYRRTERGKSTVIDSTGV